MGEDDDIYKTMALYKSVEEFMELEQAMLLAKQQNSNSKPKGRNQAQKLNKKDIERYLAMGQEAYDSNELSTLDEIYGVLMEDKVDWIPLIKARVALGLAFKGNIQVAHNLAIESYLAHPEEVDAYLALAKVMLVAESPFQARQWFDLYKKGVQNLPAGHLEFEKKVDHKVRSCTKFSFASSPFILPASKLTDTEFKFAEQRTL